MTHSRRTMPSIVAFWYRTNTALEVLSGKPSSMQHWYRTKQRTISSTHIPQTCWTTWRPKVHGCDDFSPFHYKRYTRSTGHGHRSLGTLSHLRLAGVGALLPVPRRGVLQPGAGSASGRCEWRGCCFELGYGNVSNTQYLINVFLVVFACVCRFCIRLRGEKKARIKGPYFSMVWLWVGVSFSPCWCWY